MLMDMSRDLAGFSVSRRAKDAYKDEFGSGVCVQRPSDEKVGESNAIGCLGPDGREGTKGWGENLRPSIVVDYDGVDDVEGCCEGL
jgi:hypothetical protein